MTFRAPHPAVIALYALALATGCSSKKTDPPAAYVNASITDLGGATCGIDEVSYLTIGSDPNENPNPTRVSSGSGVSVTCMVSGSGSSFDLMLSAENGQGSVTIQGTVSPDAGGPADITATFVDLTNGAFSENNCTITFVSMPQGGPVAVGRVWGQIDCPTATLQGKENQYGMPISCDLSATFIFENCLTE